MRFRFAAICAALFTIVATPAASAQICAGSMSFNFAPLQFGGAPEWSAGTTAAIGSVAAGSDRLFGTLSAGLLESQAGGDRIPHATVAVGTDQPLTVDNRWHLCPIATITYARGHGDAAGAGGRVAIGWIARNAAGLTVVPSAALGVRQMPVPANPSLQHAAELQAAIGFILRGKVALTPRAAFTRDRPVRFAVELTFDAR
jgi:hypothetical protein